MKTAPRLVIAFVLAAAGCTRNQELPSPELSSIEPSAEHTGDSVTVAIHGHAFYRQLQRHLGESVTLNENFSARLGETELLDVVRVDESLITARVPRSLAPGSYELVVEGVNGSAHLTEAFRVIASESECGNGVDDDGDNLIDCADDECAYSTCDDGDPCTTGDLCDPAGTCSGTPMDCSGAAPCVIGACDAGSCVFLPTPDVACDDGDLCSAADRCDDTGSCVGTSFSCGPPGECFASSCNGDGGCDVATTPGADCGANGKCLGDGGCSHDGPFGFSPSNFVPDSVGPPAQSLQLVNCAATLDSTSESWTAPCSDGGSHPPPRRLILGDGTEATLVVVGDFSVDSNSALHFVGSRPVVIAVFGQATIDGAIYANSMTALPGRLGAGANPVSCGTSAGGQGPGNHAGGGGGGFASAGANGGASTVTVGDGGAALTFIPTEPLRGGCPGGTSFSAAGLGGSGGGALQISVAGVLAINGSISVSGAGGRGGPGNGSGGGGGGSGGMLLLEGTVVNVGASAILTANAGGGGGGAAAGTKAGDAGMDGRTDAGDQASGGAFAGGAAPGGMGASIAGAATPGINGGGEGSGGGGGGLGVIFLRATSGNCTVGAALMSPAPIGVDCP